MPKRAKGTSFHYRDTKTGKFVPKSTWKRSKARGGTRYKREKQKPAKGEEPYSVNVEYSAEKRVNNVEVQIFAKGPKGKTRQQVINAVNYRIDNGANPKGWKIRAIEWKKASDTYKDNGSEDTWKSIKSLIQGEAKVSVEKRSNNRKSQ